MGELTAVRRRALDRRPGGLTRRHLSEERVMNDIVMSRDHLYRTARQALSSCPGVLLYGPAGIGKTHLAAMLSAEAAATDAMILRCAPVEAELRLPYLCLIDLFEAVPDEAVARLPAGLRTALRAALLRDEGPEQDQSRLRVQLAVLQTLRMLGSERPLWLSVDDIQWVDEPTAQVLGFVGRRSVDDRLRVVATERVTSGAEPLHAHLLPPGAAEISVTPMTADDIALLLSRSAGETLRAATTREIQRLSGGNPMYALELLRVLPPGGRVPSGGPLPVPPRLRGLLLGRLGTLPSEVRTVLVLASAASRPDLTMLATAYGRAATAHLEAAELNGILRIGPDGRIQFDHPMVRDAIYTAATAQQRQEAHRWLAATATEMIERARHLALSTPGQGEDVARTLVTAAAAARRRGAPDTAAELAALAAERTPASDPAARVARLLVAAEHACDAGQWEDARYRAEQVVAASGSPETRVHARLLLLRSAGQAIEELGQVIQDGLADAAGRPALEAPLREWASARELIAGRLKGAVIEARFAVDLAFDAKHAESELDTLTNLATIEMYLGEPTAATSLAQALEVARVRGLTGARVWETLRLRAYLDMFAGRYAAAEQQVMAAMVGHEEQAGLDELANMLVTLVDIRVRSGDGGGALAAGRRALTLTEDTGRAHSPVCYSASMAESIAGSVETAVTLAERGLKAARRNRDQVWAMRCLSALGRIHLLNEDHPRALDALGEARTIELHMGIADPAMGFFHADLVEAMVGAGEMDEARRVAEVITALAHRLGRTCVLACMQRAVGIQHMATGQFAAAAAALHASTAQLENAGLRLERIRGLLALSDLERRRRRQAASRAALSAARQICVDSGAKAWLPRIEQRIARSGEAVPGRAVHLAPSELRVAELAGSGATNREIAASLYLSVKTVEATLSRIYRKLEVRSRTELANTMADWKPAASTTARGARSV
jgi:DNA-binding CsgD family transcriptional regulator